ncbi:hypothetical protein F0249_01915 [Vibrio sp. 03-59-1]|uniref:hypothetical protein n=1 Tax=Vibrio sp. 03-59-1 TaxID=2607607 RepID=UPI0014937342|nr:hypothetical protein [Vibrio sp. 03-59-1]NOH82549.1 hypothetical protein [Vibrio sp. 03-59-1]
MRNQLHIVTDTFDVNDGSKTAINGTFSAKAVHLKSGMLQQPATLPSHFCYAKDARELRAREVSLDSLNTWPLRRAE